MPEPAPASSEPASDRITRAMSSQHVPALALVPRGRGAGAGAGHHDRPHASLPQPLVSRKRAASLITSDDGELPRYPSPLSSASLGPRSADAMAQMCLCPPDTKIPRPRNAFMLYRQHHQASVVAQNPGMTNPEISKVIGRKWKEEPQEVRDSWDALAEREKARHQQQYPNYKYQPRRKGKRPAALMNAEAGTSPADEWCGKCGRRSMMTPGTPATPFTPGLRTPMLPPLSTAMSMSSVAAGMNYRPPGSLNTKMPGLQLGPRRPSIPGFGDGVLSLRDSMDDDAMTPLTPAAKRRRIGPTGLALYEPQLSRRTSVPGRMDPPPPPPHPPPPSSHLRRLSVRDHPELDHSLTLPPLQTPEAKSVEAMVMTIPCVNKIRLLAKISPRLRPPGPTSPASETRGALVAIDGADPAVIERVCTWLADELSKGEGYSVKIFRAPLEQGQTAEGAAGAVGDKASCFVEYLQCIASWHRRSEEVIQYISTPPCPAASRSTAENDSASQMPPLPSPSPPPHPRPSPDPPSQSPLSARSQEEQPDPPPPTTTLSPYVPPPAAETVAGSRQIIPIALVPAYMLTRSNLAATRIPINDAYAPLDHWQWAATLWRGIVGADLTIWIKDCNSGGTNSTTSMPLHTPANIHGSFHSAGVGPTARGGDDIGRGIGTGTGNGGGVEVRDDVRALIVRRDEGKDIEARVLRRLAFEVSETVRAVGKGEFESE